jgi:hypothetical protein
LLKVRSGRCLKFTIWSLKQSRLTGECVARGPGAAPPHCRPRRPRSPRSLSAAARPMRAPSLEARPRCLAVRCFNLKGSLRGRGDRGRGACGAAGRARGGRQQCWGHTRRGARARPRAARGRGTRAWAVRACWQAEGRAAAARGGFGVASVGEGWPAGGVCACRAPAAVPPATAGRARRGERARGAVGARARAGPGAVPPAGAGRRGGPRTAGAVQQFRQCRKRRGAGGPPGPASVKLRGGRVEAPWERRRSRRRGRGGAAAAARCNSARRPRGAPAVRGAARGRAAARCGRACGRGGAGYCGGMVVGSRAPRPRPLAGHGAAARRRRFIIEHLWGRGGRGGAKGAGPCARVSGAGRPAAQGRRGPAALFYTLARPSREGADGAARGEARGPGFSAARPAGGPAATRAAHGPGRAQGAPDGAAAKTD